MKKIGIFCKAIAIIIALASLISIFAACKQDKEDDPSLEDNKELLDISGYTIVRYDKSDSNITKKTAKLKTVIKSILGLDLTVQTDWYNPNNAPDPNAKEILIDQTNRKESVDALAKLEEKETDAYIIEFTENKIVIVGKTDYSTLRGITYFIKNYVMTSPKGSKLDTAHGKSVIQDYTAIKNISVDGMLDMDIEVMSTVLESEQKVSNTLGYTATLDHVYFPSVTELQHQPNEEDNGTLIAAMSIGETPAGGPMSSLGCIMKSVDNGKTWKIIFRPTETFKPWFWAGQMSHIYELPEKVGDMPAGTLIYSANTVNYSMYSHIGVWRSFDCGKTWKQYTIVAEGGGLKEGVWEPVMFYDNGYLYCFYSDDSNRKYDQRIVYKRSKDGVNWESAVNVCAFNNFGERPGMPIITKMGNGEYFLVYEYCGEGHDCFIYYKTTKDITKWNPTDPGTPLSAKVNGADYTMASSPCCVWTPAGGECGTLFAMGRREFGGDKTIRMYVSFDYGKTWTTMENPLPYKWYNSAVAGNDSIGYRPIMVVGADPSVIHYVSITNVSYLKGTQVQYARLKLYD